MLIVAGHFVVDPADQAAFVAGRADAVRTTREEEGCLEYAITADSVDPTRVVLYERWADQACFDAHMARIQANPTTGGPRPTGFDVQIYDVGGVRAFG